jgi:uncharacterized membrane protein
MTPIPSPKASSGPVAVTGQVVATSYQGPIPPPVILREYEDLVPGSAKQIIDLFQSQSHHRMDMESRVITSDIWKSWTGLILGFIIAMSIVMAGTWLITQNHDVAGGSMITTGIASIVGAFIYGTRSQRQERTEKSKIMAGHQ